MQKRSATTLKIVLAGDPQCGKTLFMMRWKDPDGSHLTNPTIGTQLICQSVDFQGDTYKVQLWDTAGQETYHSITGPYFRSANGVFLVFDLTNKSSFDALNYWLQLIEENVSRMPLVVIIANKVDLPDHQVDTEDVAAYCKSKGLVYFVTSAMTGENVVNAAKHMVEKLALVTRKKVDEQIVSLDGGQKMDQACC
jgi:small GTP-binding protein